MTTGPKFTRRDLVKRARKAIMTDERSLAAYALTLLDEKERAELRVQQLSADIGEINTTALAYKSRAEKAEQERDEAEEAIRCLFTVVQSEADGKTKKWAIRTAWENAHRAIRLALERKGEG